MVWCIITTTTIVLRPFVWDYPGEPVPEETFTHPPSWSSSNLYYLLPSITIHSILAVQSTCLAIFLHNLCPCPVWSTSWCGALHLIFHTFLHPAAKTLLPSLPLSPVLTFLAAAYKVRAFLARLVTLAVTDKHFFGWKSWKLNFC